MELKTYIQEVQRTMPTLVIATEYIATKEFTCAMGDILPLEICKDHNVSHIQPNGRILDILHMTQGMASEVLEELKEAIVNKDRVNILEEIADIMWYVANYSVIREINISNYMFRTTGYNQSYSIKSVTPAHVLDTSIGVLVDLSKAALAYDRKIDTTKEELAVIRVLNAINDICFEYKIDVKVAMQNNIDKLRRRFAVKFDADAAQKENRDLEAERKELEK